MQVILTEEEYNELKKNRKEKLMESEAIKDMHYLMQRALIGIEPDSSGLSRMVVLKIREGDVPPVMMDIVQKRMNQRR